MPATLRSRDPAKKALCIGVEYRELAEMFSKLHMPSAARKDPVIMSKVLQEHYGYRPEDIQILTDAEGSHRLPTRENIIASMRELVRDAQLGDRLVFYFSGHGSQVQAPEDHEEEIDGHDEVIWPCDVSASLDEDGVVQVENYILDDDIKRILVNPLPAGVRLTIFLDSCSSGTGADLPFSCGPSSLSSPVDPRAINFCRPVRARVRLLPVARQRSKTITDLEYNAEGFVRDPKRRATFQSLNEWSSDERDLAALPFVTSWAACLDNQETLGGARGSVFLRALKESLKQNKQLTNAQMLNSITTWLNANVPWRKLEQVPSKPQLCSNLSTSLIYHAAFEL